MKGLLLILLSFLYISCSVGGVKTTSFEKPEGEQITEGLEGTSKIWRFAVVSDFNGSYGSTTYSSNVKSAVKYLRKNQETIDFAISTGDMVAGQKSNLNYKAMWESFHSVVTRPLKDLNIPLYPSPGNHDAYITRTIERNHYKNSWNKEKILPVSPAFQFVEDVEQNFPFYYAFKMGPALFVALDNTDPRPFNKKNMEWIEEVLEKNKDVKNKFLFGHIPLLPFAFKKETEYFSRNDKDFLDKFENLLEKYSVSVFLSGHSHVYYPGKRLGKTQFVSVPLLGGGPRYLITKSQDEPRAKHGFLIIEYSEDTEVSIKSLRSSDYSEVLDTELPELLDMPSRNTGKCRRCKEFPKSLFLDPSERILYLRRDM